MPVVANPKKYSVIYNSIKNKIIEYGDFELNIDLVKKSNFKNHLHNTRNFSQSPDVYKPVIENIYSIPPKSQWSFNDVGASFINDVINEDSNKSSPRGIHGILKKYAQLLGSNDVVFEVSGGLDTSLLISIFGEHLTGYSQIGVVSNRYEFRTEREIQEYFFNKCENSIRINESDALPFSQLSKVPVHLLPNKASLFYGRHKAVIDATNELGAKFVINGIGLDPMLCNPVFGEINEFRLSKHQWEDDWANSYLYRPQGLEYVNASVRNPVISYLWKTRKNQKEDSQKIWARKFFFNKLPDYLTKYRYKGAFDGVYETGLKNNHEEIMNIYDIAYGVLEWDELCPKRNRNLLIRSENINQEEEINLMSTLSFAVWIHSMVRDGLI